MKQQSITLFNFRRLACLFVAAPSLFYCSPLRADARVNIGNRPHPKPQPKPKPQQQWTLQSLCSVASKSPTYQLPQTMTYDKYGWAGETTGKFMPLWAFGSFDSEQEAINARFGQCWETLNDARSRDTVHGSPHDRGQFDGSSPGTRVPNYCEQPACKKNGKGSYLANAQFCDSLYDCCAEWNPGTIIKCKMIASPKNNNTNVECYARQLGYFSDCMSGDAQSNVQGCLNLAAEVGNGTNCGGGAPTSGILLSYVLDRKDMEYLPKSWNRPYYQKKKRSDIENAIYREVGTLSNREKALAGLGHVCNNTAYSRVAQNSACVLAISSMNAGGVGSQALAAVQEGCNRSSNNSAYSKKDLCEYAQSTPYHLFFATPATSTFSNLGPFYERSWKHACFGGMGWMGYGTSGYEATTTTSYQVGLSGGVNMCSVNHNGNTVYAFVFGTPEERKYFSHFYKCKNKKGDDWQNSCAVVANSCSQNPEHSACQAIADDGDIQNNIATVARGTDVNAKDAVLGMSTSCNKGYQDVCQNLCWTSTATGYGGQLLCSYVFKQCNATSGNNTACASIGNQDRFAQNVLAIAEASQNAQKNTTKWNNLKYATDALERSCYLGYTAACQQLCKNRNIRDNENRLVCNRLSQACIAGSEAACTQVNADASVLKFYVDGGANLLSDRVTAAKGLEAACNFQQEQACQAMQADANVNNLLHGGWQLQSLCAIVPYKSGYQVPLSNTYPKYGWGKTATGQYMFLWGYGPRAGYVNQKEALSAVKGQCWWAINDARARATITNSSQWSSVSDHHWGSGNDNMTGIRYCGGGGCSRAETKDQYCNELYDCCSMFTKTTMIKCKMIASSSWANNTSRECYARQLGYFSKCLGGNAQSNVQGCLNLAAEVGNGTNCGGGAPNSGKLLSLVLERDNIRSNIENAMYGTIKSGNTVSYATFSDRDKALAGLGHVCNNTAYSQVAQNGACILAISSMNAGGSVGDAALAAVKAGCKRSHNNNVCKYASHTPYYLFFASLAQNKFSNLGPFYEISWKHACYEGMKWVGYGTSGYEATTTTSYQVGLSGGVSYCHVNHNGNTIDGFVFKALEDRDYFAHFYKCKNKKGNDWQNSCVVVANNCSNDPKYEACNAIAVDADIQNNIANVAQGTDNNAKEAALGLSWSCNKGYQDVCQNLCWTSTATGYGGQLLCSYVLKQCNATSGDNAACISIGDKSKFAENAFTIVQNSQGASKNTTKWDNLKYATDALERSCYFGHTFACQQLCKDSNYRDAEDRLVCNRLSQACIAGSEAACKEVNTDVSVLQSYASGGANLLSDRKTAANGLVTACVQYNQKDACSALYKLRYHAKDASVRKLVNKGIVQACVQGNDKACYNQMMVGFAPLCMIIPKKPSGSGYQLPIAVNVKQTEWGITLGGSKAHTMLNAWGFGDGQSCQNKAGQCWTAIEDLRGRIQGMTNSKPTDYCSLGCGGKTSNCLSMPFHKEQLCGTLFDCCAKGSPSFVGADGKTHDTFIKCIMVPTAAGRTCLAPLLQDFNQCMAGTASSCAALANECYKGTTCKKTKGACDLIQLVVKLNSTNTIIALAQQAKASSDYANGVTTVLASICNDSSFTSTVRDQACYAAGYALGGNAQIKAGAAKGLVDACVNGSLYSACNAIIGLLPTYVTQANLNTFKNKIETAGLKQLESYGTPTQAVVTYLSNGLQESCKNGTKLACNFIKLLWSRPIAQCKKQATSKDSGGKYNCLLLMDACNGGNGSQPNFEICKLFAEKDTKLLANLYALALGGTASNLSGGSNLSIPESVRTNAFTGLVTLCQAHNQLACNFLCSSTENKAPNGSLFCSSVIELCLGSSTNTPACKTVGTANTSNHRGTASVVGAIAHKYPNEPKGKIALAALGHSCFLSYTGCAENKHSYACTQKKSACPTFFTLVGVNECRANAFSKAKSGPNKGELNCNVLVRKCTGASDPEPAACLALAHKGIIDNLAKIVQNPENATQGATALQGLQALCSQGHKSACAAMCPASDFQDSSGRWVCSYVGDICAGISAGVTDASTGGSESAGSPAACTVVNQDAVSTNLYHLALQPHTPSGRGAFKGLQASCSLNNKNACAQMTKLWSHTVNFCASDPMGRDGAGVLYCNVLAKSCAKDNEGACMQINNSNVTQSLLQIIQQGSNAEKEVALSGLQTSCDYGNQTACEAMCSNKDLKDTQGNLVCGLLAKSCATSFVDSAACKAVGDTSIAQTLGALKSAQQCTSSGTGKNIKHSPGCSEITVIENGLSVACSFGHEAACGPAGKTAPTLQLGYEACKRLVKKTKSKKLEIKQAQADLQELTTQLATLTQKAYKDKTKLHQNVLQLQAIQKVVQKINKLNSEAVTYYNKQQNLYSQGQQVNQKLGKLISQNEYYSTDFLNETFQLSEIAYQFADVMTELANKRIQSLKEMVRHKFVEPISPSIDAHVEEVNYQFIGNIEVDYKALTLPLSILTQGTQNATAKVQQLVSETDSLRKTVESDAKQLKKLHKKYQAKLAILQKRTSKELQLAASDCQQQFQAAQLAAQGIDQTVNQLAGGLGCLYTLAVMGNCEEGYAVGTFAESILAQTPVGQKWLKNLANFFNQYPGFEVAFIAVGTLAQYFSASSGGAASPMISGVMGYVIGAYQGNTKKAEKDLFKGALESVTIAAGFGAGVGEVQAISEGAQAICTAVKGNKMVCHDLGLPAHYISAAEDWAAGEIYEGLNAVPPAGFIARKITEFVGWNAREFVKYIVVPFWDEAKGTSNAYTGMYLSNLSFSDSHM